MTQHWILAGVFALSAVGSAQTVTELLRSGPNGSKFNMAIIGEGFTSTQQNAFATFVDTAILRGVFRESITGSDDFYPAVMNAFNIFRVDAVSAQSGVTTVNSTGGVTNQVNTFLGYRLSGVQARCWVESSQSTATNPTLTNPTLTNTLNNSVPGWNYAVVIINTGSFGACRQGNMLVVTTGAGFTLAQHEMGHMIGDLGDEYTGPNTYMSTEPSRVNLTINTNRSTLKWNVFVNPSTPIPTNAGTFTGSASDDAGVFAGGRWNSTNFNAGIFRPASNCRMAGNAPPFCPVCYNKLQESVDGRHDYVYSNVYTGHFTAGNRDSVVVHNGNSLALYRGGGDQIDPFWIRTLPDNVWDSFRPGDKFFPGDFDGDGLQDLFVFNATDWNQPYFAMLRATGTGFEGIRRFDRELPGWGDMTANDKFMVGDFNGDGRADIAVFNGQDFSIGYLLILRSTGNDLAFVRRFDDQLPNWDSMKRNDQFLVADFDSDKRDDFYVVNLRDFSVGYLLMLRSTGNDLVGGQRFDDQLPGWDSMKVNDQFFVADFDGDRRKDLYVFNGPDWSRPYLMMLRSTGSGLTPTRLFDRDVPGWGEMRPRDRWIVADLNADGKQDLYVYNAEDWSFEYLGTLRSSGSNLDGGWQEDWVGSWNLGRNDQFRVANFNGGSGWQDLIVFNNDWMGLLRSLNGSSSLSAIYPKWVHNHNFHSAGWW